MLEYNYYDHTNYPLQHFHYKAIPKCMIKVIEKLDKNFDLVVRGGLSYILITDDYSYDLKDIDLAMKTIDSEEIYKSIKKDADEVFYNKNTFGDDVLTLFWKNGDTYFKLDILLVNKMPNYITTEFEFINKSIKVMDVVELWYNRICKVAEKALRKHSNEKTLNHYMVVIRSAQFLLKSDKRNMTFIKEIGLEKVNEKISDSIIILKELLNTSELEEYKDITLRVIKEFMEVNNEDFNLSVKKSW